jgi:hypothetical protein
MKLNHALILTILLLFSSCAHRMVGTVAMKVNEREAHVCLNKDEVKVGERLIAYYNKCENENNDFPDRLGTPCVKTKLGGATVKKILNNHYSLVEFDEGVKFSEGTFVETK